MEWWVTTKKWTFSFLLPYLSSHFLVWLKPSITTKKACIVLFHQMDKEVEKNTVICPPSWWRVASNLQKLSDRLLLAQGGSSCEGLTWTSSKERVPLHPLHLLSCKTRSERLVKLSCIFTSPWPLRSTRCPSPKGHQSITWLNIQTRTKSTHIVHGMHFPNAKEVKTNQNAKLWISCKAFVNTPLQTLVYFGFSCSHYQVIPRLWEVTATQLKVREVSDYIQESGVCRADIREYDVKGYWTGRETNSHRSPWLITWRHRFTIQIRFALHEHCFPVDRVKTPRCCAHRSISFSSRSYLSATFKSTKWAVK